MKKLLFGILGVLILAVVAILGLAVTKPDTYHVERQVTIAAPPATIFAAVNDFHEWAEWSPWEGLDPAMTRSFGGPESGVEATYAWAGNDQVGKGKMTIVAAEPDARIDIRLEFLEPWQSTNQTKFEFQPVAEGTQVTWGMDGTNSFVSKVFTVFMDMDQMIGKDFEKGLGNLKTLGESAPADSTSMEATQTGS